MDRLWNAVPARIGRFGGREALCRVETAAVTDSYVIKIIRDPTGDA